LIAYAANRIKSAPRERASHDGSSMAHSYIVNSHLLNSQGFSVNPPYAALMAPRSRRDNRDMSDYKAINKTIRVFLVEEFSISPGGAGQLPKKVIVTFLIWKYTLPHEKNTNLSGVSHVYRNNSAKNYAGGTGVAEKTSLGSVPEETSGIAKPKGANGLTTETLGFLG
jgi:hypothetical protein